MLKDTNFTMTSGQRAQLEMLGTEAIHCMAEGGSRSSKTFGWCYFLALRATSLPSNHLVVRRYYKDCRQAVALDTFPKMLNIAYPGAGATWHLNKTDWFIDMQSVGGASRIWFAGMDDVSRMDKCLGREYSTVFFNEASELPFESVVLLRSRLAERSGLRLKAFYDQNPPTKTHWTFKEFHQGINPLTREEKVREWARLYAHIKINPECNTSNVAEGYIENILMGMPERQKRRFLEGEYQDDVENALWKQSNLDHFRVTEAPELVRLGIAVDPAVSLTSTSDEIGIVVGGQARDGHYYILDDLSLKALPADWARVVLDAYRTRKADRVIAEINQGGNLVEANIRNAPGGQNVSYLGVHASRGKITRAEPISTLYERGLVHHVGVHRYLEDEMTTYNPLDKDQDSPNRMDALVWLLTWLGRVDDDEFTDGDLLKGCVR
jgi:predicted phage terminase large subunit-like protein